MLSEEKLMRNNFLFKALRSLAAGILSITVVSCVLPESERVPEVFQMNPSATDLSAFQTSISVTVQCDLHWTAQLQDPSWGSIAIKSEKESTGGSFMVTLQPNLTEEERTNAIILKAGKSELKQTIRQGGLGTFFSPRQLQLAGTAEASVSFNSPLSWKAQLVGDPDWLTLTRSNGSGGNSHIVCVAKDENVNVGSREAVIRVTIGESQVDIPVVQAQKDVILTEDGADVALYYDDASLTVHTQYNVEYKIETSASWISHVSTKAPLHTAAEVFALEQNPAPQPRSAEIRFTDKANPETSLVVKVTQGGKDPILSVTEPGFYGIDGVNYRQGEDGFNQSSVREAAGEPLRFRLLNASALKAVTVSGLKEDTTRGSQLILQVKVQEKAKVLYSNYITTTVLEVKDGTYWLKESDATYFVLKK